MRAALHADAVVAVAGDRVDVAELLDVVVDGVADRGQRAEDSARRLAGGLAGRRLVLLGLAGVDVVTGSAWAAAVLPAAARSPLR